MDEGSSTAYGSGVQTTGAFEVSVTSSEQYATSASQAGSSSIKFAQQKANGSVLLNILTYDDQNPDKMVANLIKTISLVVCCVTLLFP